MIELKKPDRSKLEVKYGDTKIIFYVKAPKNSDRIKFESKQFKLLSNKEIDNSELEKLQNELYEIILNLVEGFEEGAFAVDGKIISCDDTKENYYSGWKELLKDYYPDIVLAIGFKIFEIKPIEVKYLPFGSN
jgi:hypothetical protein